MSDQTSHLIRIPAFILHKNTGPIALKIIALL